MELKFRRKCNRLFNKSKKFFYIFKENRDKYEHPFNNLVRNKQGSNMSPPSKSIVLILIGLFEKMILSWIYYYSPDRLYKISKQKIFICIFTPKLNPSFSLLIN